MEDLVISGTIGFIIIILLIIMAILWFFLPFAIFGTKNRLDKTISLLKQVSSQLEKICILLDPEDEKSALHTKYLQRKEAEALAEDMRKKKEKWVIEETLRKQKEDEKQKHIVKKKGEKELKKLEKLSKKQGTFTCPHCNQLLIIKDLRSGLEHKCPSCNGVFEI